jgi:hypothetical protein
MKTYGRVDVWIHLFLTLALVGGEWSALPPEKMPPIPIGEEAVWPPEPAWKTGDEKKLAPTGT